MKALSDWRLVRRFALSPEGGFSMNGVLGLSADAWKDLVALASEWSHHADLEAARAAEQREGIIKRALDDEKKERLNNLFYSCGGGDDQ